MTSTSPHFDNRITQLLGVDVPIANSPMGFVVKPDLVAAVANAGGIPSVGQVAGRIDSLLPASEIMRQTVEEFREAVRALSEQYLGVEG